MASCPLCRHHRGSSVTKAGPRCPNRLPLRDPSGSRTCSQRQTRALPESGNALQGTSPCFSLKNTQAAVPQPYYSWTSCTHSFLPLPAGALLPPLSASSCWRLCCSPSPCPLCSWILPLAPSSQHPFLCPAHMQEHAAPSCPGWLMFASPPRQRSQPRKQAVLVSCPFFICGARHFPRASLSDSGIHLSHR